MSDGDVGLVTLNIVVRRRAGTGFPWGGESVHGGSPVLRTVVPAWNRFANLWLLRNVRAIVRLLRRLGSDLRHATTSHDDTASEFGEILEGRNDASGVRRWDWLRELVELSVGGKRWGDVIWEFRAIRVRVVVIVLCGGGRGGRRCG